MPYKRIVTVPIIDRDTDPYRFCLSTSFTDVPTLLQGGLLERPRKTGKTGKKEHEKAVCARSPILCQKSNKTYMQTSGEKFTLGPAVGRFLGTGTQCIPAVRLFTSRNRRVRPRGEVSSLVNNSGGGQHLTQHWYMEIAVTSVPALYSHARDH